MIPGIIPFGAPIQEAQTYQFGRYTYNSGYVIFGTININLKTVVPPVINGDNMRLDALWWQGAWCALWQPRVAFYFKYGNPYYSGIINGGTSKNHYIYFNYDGGETATVYHGYSGDSTDFKQVEASIDRLIWYNTQDLPSNYFEKNLPA